MAVEYNKLFGDIPEKVEKFCDSFETSAEDMKLVKLNNCWVLLNENDGLKIYIADNGKVMFFTIK